MGRYLVVLVMVACGRSTDPQPGQQQATQTPAATSDTSATVDTPFSPARPGRPFFCRTIAFFNPSKPEMRRLGYCRLDLADCNKIVDVAGAIMDSTGNGETRMVSACEEYPVAYCYVTKTSREAFKANPEIYRRNLMKGAIEPLDRCFTDVVVCRDERNRDVSANESATDCFPAGNVWVD
jgi:hypothetical protein